MLGILYSIGAFIVAIGVLVTIHEFGHFWVARKMGVRVLRFSVGFGSPIWSWTSPRDGTEYVVAAIPLGGYVKMLDEREGNVDDAELEQAFNRKSVGKRFAIVAAGPIFNFIFAVVAYYLIFVTGVAGVKPMLGEVQQGTSAYSAGLKRGDVILAVNDVEVASWERLRFALLDHTIAGESIRVRVLTENQETYERVLDVDGINALQDEQIDPATELGFTTWRPDIAPTIDEVIAGGAAQEAGVQQGDQVVAIGETRIRNARQWVDLIRANPDQALSLQVRRGESIVDLTITPRSRTENAETFGYIGVRNRVDIPEDIRQQMMVTESFGLLGSIPESMQKTWDMTWLTLRVIGKLIIGEASVKNLSGPISIAQYAGVTASIGLEAFLGFLAIISISLGVLNLMPVPMLDGGHLFYYVIEMIKGSPVSEAVEVIGQKIGLALLIMLMSLAVYNDLMRIAG